MKAKKQLKKTGITKETKPDFHVTDRILFVSLILLVFTATASMAATKTTAKSVPAIKPTVVAPPALVLNNPGCAHKLLLGGKFGAEQSGLLSAVSGSATSYEKLNSALDEGCGFRLVKNSGMGGGSGRESFDCGYAHTEDGDNVFYCDSYSFQNGKNAESVKEGFRFETGKVFYIGNGQQQPSGSGNVSLYQY